MENDGKYQVAQNYITLYKEKYPSNDALEILSELELQARLKTKTDLDRRFKRLMEKRCEITFLHI